MDKWEHMVLQLDSHHKRVYDARTGDKIFDWTLDEYNNAAMEVNVLAALGEAGWELIDQTSAAWYFRRPKP